MGAPSSWTGFSDAFQQGRRDILVLRLVRVSDPTRSVRRDQPRTWWRWFAWSWWPLLLAAGSEVLGAGWGGRLSPDQWVLLGVLILINTGAIAAAGLAWNFATDRADSVDVLLSTSSKRDQAVEPLVRAMQLRRQLILPLLLAVIPLLWQAALVVVHGPRPASDWALAQAGAWTLILVGNDVYWLLVPPLVVWHLRASTDLNLRWHDPARTPGIRTLAEGYGLSAFLFAWAAVAVTVPGLAGWPVFGRSTALLYVGLVAVSLWIGLFTQVLLYGIVRRARLAIADELSLRRPRATDAMAANISYWADAATLYVSVANASNLPYGSAVVVQYFAAIAGSVVGYLLQRPR